MGKSTADLPIQNVGQSVPQAQNPLSAGTPESTSATRREREVNLGGQHRSLEIPNRNTCVLNEGIVEDCDEDGGEGSDPPTRSFLRKRLDEQSRSVEQTFSRGIDKLHDVILNSTEQQTRLLEMLVSKFSDGRPFDPFQRLPPRNNPLPMVQAEPIPARPKPIDLEKVGGSNSRSDGIDQRVEATPVDMTEVQRMIDSAMKKGPKFPKFIHPYPAYIETFGYPKGFKIPDFSLFAGESSLSSLEHVARFTAQCGDVHSDFHKLRLFNFSLTGSAFAWYINLPPNSIQNWEELVEKFHEQFYRPGLEVSVSSLARMAQASDESPMDYLTRFKSARNWCRVPLPEVEFVRLALNGLDVEYKKKFLGANVRDMYELAQHVEQYDYLLREEKISKTPSRGTIYKNPTVSYASTEDECVSVDAAEIVIDKPYVCKALTQVDSREVKSRSATEGTLKPSKVYTFDTTKADAIFDQLLSARIIKLRPGHNIPKAEELKGKVYCKYHNSSKHTTNNCVVFRDNVQSWIDNGKLKFPEKKMSIDADPFPTATVNMVNAYLPKDKGKGKAEVVATQDFRTQNSRPRFMADFRSNKPPTALTGPAIVKPMRDYSTDEDSGTAVFCSKCRAKVGSEPEEKPSSPITERPTAAIQQKAAGVGRHQGVFDRLGPKVKMEETPSVRRRLDFGASFYDEDYYTRNSGSSESSRSQKTFKPPEPKDQRWYTYHSSKGVYTALSKSQKRRHQRIDCMARRQAAQETSAPKWRPNDTVATGDERPSPTIMTELGQGKRLVDRDIETTFEEADKRIKLLLRPGEMKARLEHFRQEAESKLAQPAIQEPLIKIRRNLHPPFLGEALEYMREFHKKHSANDLYGLPKACQDTIDLVLTCPDAERIIQKTSDPGLKARFQHIREARVLGFEVDPYTDIVAADLPFSMEDLQYLRYHFEVFSAVSLFGLTTDEVARVARLDAYLDTRDARLYYQEQVQVLTQSTLSISTSPAAVTQNQQAAEAAPQVQTLEEGTEESFCPTLTKTEPAVVDQTRDEVSEEGPNPMGPSVLDNMEISMVHVLPADFQSSTAQPNFLDGDVVAEETGHVDFVSIAEDESTTKDDSLKAALTELFPRSSSAALHHLKPLYVTAHIEGYPVSKVFVDCGATVNILPLNIMKALRRSNDELIPSGITMSSFVGDKSQTKGVLPLTVTIAGRTHMTAFFVVDSKTEYNALLGRDWIHQTSCIPSSLYQVLVFWDGKSVTVHPADNQPFETNMIQARYYDDHVGYITLQGFNDEGRPTRISVQKAIEVGAETVHQDSARLGLANFLPEADV
ncbi:hypothetical protein ACFX1T_015311 [Malus domestica]